MRITHRSATVAASLLLGLVGAVPAQAAGTQQGQSCNVYVETGAVECYKTYRESIFHATNGLVTNAPADARTAMASEDFARRLNSMVRADGTPVSGVTDVVISTSYQHPNGGGSIISHVRPSGCDTDTGWEWSLNDIDDFDTAWDDRISSWRGYSNCQVNMWEDPGYGGAQTGWHTNLMNMGLMEDEASSIAWR
ncbi:hypothetical protein [Streptomyces niveus]|uniref:hypothetical protein n=1 Tax=Streptomyces niveus TaxID=193462 RepID=UPI000A9330BA|nr:hypothetical protein [Streptomyces niveus]